MRYYKWSEQGEGRKIGKLGNYCLYEKTITEGKCEETQKPFTPQTYGSFRFIYGPSAGGLLESIKFVITTNGEKILGIEAEVYKNRTIKISGLPIDDAILKVERINAPFSASHTIAFLLAIEDALELELDYQTLLKRIAEIELERIRNHLFVIARLTETASLNVPTFHLLHLIEEVNRLIGKICGHRYFFGVNSLNEVRCDFGNLLKIIDITKEFKQIFDGLVESRIFIDRLQENGKIKDENSLGPAARAAGFNYDARKDFKVLPYDDLGFKTITTHESDSFGRFLVRGLEILESSKMLVTLYDMIKNNNTNHRKIKESYKKAGEGLVRVESPSGDLAYYVNLDNGIVKSVSLLTPSQVNLSLFLKSVINTIFTDFQFNWESYGIWVSELGVKLE
ncbi:formate hydrogenlyase [Saccharolobus solfataricus]|uniref:Formate hydrogenlyase n=1 Tax=Saccharolobus solfataricus TaxID=2287 RepID=A0A7S9IGA5_SACSO|nr:formate hydrogenlyase [Saccharolobus solfataricus]QPG48593.1 formate hydrogenlyase [Saccharolobus solfataricus]